MNHDKEPTPAPDPYAVQAARRAIGEADPLPAPAEAGPAEHLAVLLAASKALHLLDAEYVTIGKRGGDKARDHLAAYDLALEAHELATRYADLGDRDGGRALAVAGLLGAAARRLEPWGWNSLEVRNLKHHAEAIERIAVDLEPKPEGER